ncbi:MAG TPA: porin family protein [Bacteroidia bacterium]|jgi:hypothetical protein|nr:porin family protein [Bacteroidia bacterium]
MKTNTLILLSFLALTPVIHAQSNATDVRENLLFGLKGGMNISNVYDTQGDAFRANPKAGFAGGAFLSIPIGRYLGIQPEVIFSQKGFRGSGMLFGSNYDFSRTTNFIDIPLFFMLKPSEFFTLLAGPQFSYLVQQKDVFTNGNSTTQQQQEFENDNIRRNILCFVIGGDITLKHVVLGGRAGWDVQNNNGDGTSSTPRYKNVWYQFTIGYRFY